jgi:ABC-type phosphate transport system auxiliary subunit
MSEDYARQRVRELTAEVERLRVVGQQAWSELQLVRKALDQVSAEAERADREAVARADRAEAALKVVHKQFLYYAKRHRGDTGIICGKADIEADELARAALRDTAPKEE